MQKQVPNWRMMQKQPMGPIVPKLNQDLVTPPSSSHQDELSDGDHMTICPYCLLGIRAQV